MKIWVYKTTCEYYIRPQRRKPRDLPGWGRKPVLYNFVFCHEQTSKIPTFRRLPLQRWVSIKVTRDK